MVTLRQAIEDSVRGFVCSASQSSDPWRNYLRQATSGIVGLGSAAAAGDATIDAFSDLVCSDVGGASGGGGAGATWPPAGPQPGQCEFAAYIVGYRYVAGNGLVTDTQVDALLGPIGEIVVEPNGSGNFDIFIPCRGIEGLQVQPPGFRFQVGGNIPGPVTEEEITSITIKGSQVDDCGPIIPQGPPEGDDIIDYDDENGNPVVNIPINIVGGSPTINNNGNVVIPVVIINNFFEFNVNFNLSLGGITFNIGGGNSGGTCCPQVEDTESEPDDDDPPEPENDLRFWGVHVKSIVNETNREATEVGDGIGPSIFLPDLGWIRFAIEVGGKRGWTDKVVIQTKSQHIPVNAPAVAYDYYILTRPGVVAQATPILVENPTT